jgi:hypothetical protein
MEVKLGFDTGRDLAVNVVCWAKRLLKKEKRLEYDREPPLEGSTPATVENPPALTPFHTIQDSGSRPPSS